MAVSLSLQEGSIDGWVGRVEPLCYCMYVHRCLRPCEIFEKWLHIDIIDGRLVDFLSFQSLYSIGDISKRRVSEGSLVSVGLNIAAGLIKLPSPGSDPPHPRLPT